MARKSLVILFQIIAINPFISCAYELGVKCLEFLLSIVNVGVGSKQELTRKFIA